VLEICPDALFLGDIAVPWVNQSHAGVSRGPERSKVMASNDRKKRAGASRRGTRLVAPQESAEATRRRIVAEMQARRDKDIARHGWQAMCVGRTQSDSQDQPVWCYTIGLHGTTGGPEFIIFGLPGEVAHGILTALADRLKAGEQFAGGRYYDGVLRDFPVFIGAVPVDDYVGYVQQAINQYGGLPNFPLLQVVWPDKNGRYPWDANVVDGLATAQPLLCPLPDQGTEPPAR